MKFITYAAIFAAMIPTITFAQSKVNQAYALTSEKKGSMNWTEVKLIDLNTGDVIKNVFESNKGVYSVYEARTMREIKLRNATGVVKDETLLPFSSTSAACAYDKKLNRLYFTPMFINELRYIDLSAATPKVYIFNNEPFSTAKDLDNQANQITRMVIAYDGNGYALSNDGSHLIKFTTDEKPVITDLGGLNDAATNDEMKIADANTSWGGDLIADASGNIYIISAQNHLFKIDILSMRATYITKIKDLPDGFTTNGAVVDRDGQVILTSANSIVAYYKVDTKNWTATPITNNEQVFNTSDLANENFLFETGLQATAPVNAGNEKISLYPNPVKTNVFKVSFSDKNLGKYNVQLVDVAGRMVSDKSVTVAGPGQVSEVRINPLLSRGMYMVKILDNDKKEVFSRKVVVE